MAILHQLRCTRSEPDAARPPAGARRFVLHRHRDENGSHLDLRLEQEGYLMGFRIEGSALEETVWAAVKPPHPLTWLTQDGPAIREDEGTYYWDSGDASEGVLVLCGKRYTLSVWVDAVTDVSATAVAALRSAAAGLGVDLGAMAALAEDGAAARARAIARYRGLGRELDGDAFDDGLWQKTLAGERLTVIQQYLHALEVRFDRKYPPQPVSAPVLLEDEEQSGDQERALGILRS